MQKEKILIVPDIHGRDFWKCAYDFDEEIVFLGDYVDPYPNEQISSQDTLENFKEILDFARSREGVILLLGNHDCSYLDMNPIKCRFMYNIADDIYKLFKENENLFKLAYKWNNTLFTHAGVSENWLCENENISENFSNITSDNICDKLNSFVKFGNKYLYDEKNYYPYEDITPLHDIGYIRGGYSPSGSCIWADLTETHRNPAFKDELIQIFGHTQLKNTGSFYHNKNIYCCDSRYCFTWNNNDLSPYPVPPLTLVI